MKLTSILALLGTGLGSFFLTGCDSEYSSDMPIITISTDGMDNVTGVQATASVSNDDSGATMGGSGSVAVTNGHGGNCSTNTHFCGGRYGDTPFTPSVSVDCNPNTVSVGVCYSGTVSGSPVNVGVNATVDVNSGNTTVSSCVSMQF